MRVRVKVRVKRTFSEAKCSSRSKSSRGGPLGSRREGGETAGLSGGSGCSNCGGMRGRVGVRGRGRVRVRANLQQLVAVQRAVATRVDLVELLPQLGLVDAG